MFTLCMKNASNKANARWIERLGSYPPTIEIAFFSVNGINCEQLESIVKEAIYVPAKNAKREVFKISSHGAIFE